MSVPDTNYDRIDLTGSWGIQPDPFEEGERCGYPDPEFAESSWPDAIVPGTFERALPSLAGYEGAVWYRKTVQVPTGWRDRRVVIFFAGANHRTTVWINGVQVGCNLDGFLPFEFPIHDQLSFGAENLVAVRVDSTRRFEDVPGRQRGWKPHGGILREVGLAATGHTRIQSVRITAEPGTGGGALDAVVQLVTGTESVEEYSVVLTLGERGTLLAQFEAAAATRVRLGGKVTGARPWSPEKPQLYDVTIELLHNGEPVDCRELRVGFRSITSSGTNLLLNGAPVFLTGFNLHEDSPDTDFCPDPELRLRDLLDMKQAGCNFVRLCHYPHHIGTLEMCDEIGLLAMAEIPLYWWQGCREGEENFAAKSESARRQLTRMIERDFNHPSIVMWAVSNETSEELPEVVAGNAELVRLCKTLDSGRLATHVSNRWFQHPHFEEDDLIAVNGYPTYEILSGDQSTDSRSWWESQLAQVHSLYPDKPVLVSEFGYPAMDGVVTGSAGEDAQAAAIEQEYSAFHQSYLCGTVVWCYADHPWPEGCFINGISVSPYGVLTRGRRKKKAFAVVQELFTKMQRQRK